MDRKTGYVLLWTGAGIILYSILLAWKVFSGAVPPPALIDIKTVSIPLASSQFELPMGPQISKMANISLYFLFLLFVAGTGSRLGNLGVKLISPLKEEQKRTAP